MTGASIQSPDRTSVPPKADVRAAAVVPPVAAASVVEPIASTRQPSLGVSSRDLPAASSGAAGLSDCIGDRDADIDAAITALELAWLRAGILMNAATLATIAASESFSNSTSSVGA